MGVHHTANVLWEAIPLCINAALMFVHGVAFPIMAFFLTEGFRRTSNIKRYMLRLLIFAVIAQVPHTLAFGSFMPNIIFTILLSLLCLLMYEKMYVEKGKHGAFVTLFILIMIASAVLTFEGGLIGTLLIFMYHVIKDEKKRRVWPLVMYGGALALFTVFGQVAIRFLGQMSEIMPELSVIIAGEDVQGYARMSLELMQNYFFVPLGPFLIIPLLLAYNGERGRRAKWLFYAFYPGHFIVLVAIAAILGIASFS